MLNSVFGLDLAKGNGGNVGPGLAQDCQLRERAQGNRQVQCPVAGPVHERPAIDNRNWKLEVSALP